LPKGQIWSLDLLAGLVMISLLIMLFILEWNYIAIRWDSSESYRELLGAGLFSADALFTTPGEPPGWERMANITTANISALGLVNGRNELVNAKLDALYSLNQTNESYDFVRTKLGIPGYNIHLMIKSLNGEALLYEFGRPSSLNNSVVVDRIVLLNATPARAKVEVWR